ncbi:DUF2946 domain-containing protein [Rhizobium deserti]|uniref:DUF2946 domain-containing protein n=1 Tax=Rhizobium deserti TaxID=2547961 RepID=A0A4R5UN23_9HYPH|nr:DUF2946 family protein [Rhizobium deserti]TDK39286.1 DUF2946 domain-containing protein [Rhizobium deserti]
MRIIRQITGDVMSGGLIAVLLALTMLLQGALGGYTQSAMASVGPAGEIICSSHGAVAPAEQPGDKHSSDCCLTGCQLASSLPTILPALGSSLATAPASNPDITRHSTDDNFSPRLIGLAGRPRAPPVLPV